MDFVLSMYKFKRGSRNPFHGFSSVPCEGDSLESLNIEVYSSLKPENPPIFVENSLNSVGG